MRVEAEAGTCVAALRDGRRFLVEAGGRLGIADKLKETPLLGVVDDVTAVDALAVDSGEAEVVVS